MTLREINSETVEVRRDSTGRVIERFFDKYGNPRFKPNTPEANRKMLAMIRTKPSTKPKGGYRARPPKRKLKGYQI